jgi:Glycosyltransferase family 87
VGKRNLYAFVFGMQCIWMFSGVVLTVLFADRHDYASYLVHWELVLEGRNPWATVPTPFGQNTYGPLYNLIAFLTLAHPLAPKLAILFVFFVATSLLLKRIVDIGDTDAAWLYALAVPLNCNITLLGLGFASNDLLCAAFFLFAILSRIDGRCISAGIWLGLAGLLKWYPLAFFPLFMIEHRTIRLEVAAAASFTFATGMVLAYVWWGRAVLEPIMIGATREAAFLNSIEPLQELLVHFGLTGLGAELVRSNSVIVLLMLAGLFALMWYQGRNWLEALIPAMFGTLFVYKIGHSQFYITWAVAIAAQPLYANWRRNATAWKAIPMLAFTSLVAALLVLWNSFLDAILVQLRYVFLIAGTTTLFLLIRTKTVHKDQSGI